MPAPTYRVVGVRGAQHDQIFEVEVLLGADPAIARGEGRSKRLAERAAASAALLAFARPKDAPQ